MKKYTAYEILTETLAITASFSASTIVGYATASILPKPRNRLTKAYQNLGRMALGSAAGHVAQKETRRTMREFRQLFIEAQTELKTN